MTPSPPVFGPADCVDSWLHGALDGPESPGYGTARSALFNAVRADRGGSVPRKLFARTTDRDPRVRAAVIRLLTELSLNGPPWPEATRCAVRRLHDRDDRVRRAAGWLLAGSDPAQARELLQAPSPGLDPVARLALTEALFEPWTQSDPAELLALATALRHDHDPAVRLRAALGVLRLGLSDHWESWESSVLADLDAGGDRIGGPGGLLTIRAGTVWGLGARYHGDEEACLTMVIRLSAAPTPTRRRAAVDIAAVAMRHWRAAPGRLVPHLRPLLADGTAEVRATTVTVLGASLEATGLCRDELARLLDDPSCGDAAALALARVGDDRAVPRLTGLIGPGHHQSELGEATTGLAEAAADLTSLVTAARQALGRHGDHCSTDARPGDCPTVSAVAVLRACGPAASDAVPELGRQLALVADADSGHPSWLRTQLLLSLGAIGPAAAPAVALLTPVTSAQTDDVALRSVLGITEDRRLAERAFDSALQQPPRRARRRILYLLEWLGGHGGLDDQHISHLRALVAEPRYRHPRLLVLLGEHGGEPVVDALLEVLPRCLNDDVVGIYACTVLAEMGPAAAPALPALRALLDAPLRVPMYTGDEDYEMRADERLDAAARRTYEHIRRSGQPRPRAGIR